MAITKKDIDSLEQRYTKLLREKERQQVRLEEAMKKLENFGITEEELPQEIEALETKISEMETKLESNITKMDAKLSKLEELINNDN